MKYEKILIIDDDEDDQELFLTAIEQLSAPVECVTSNSAEQSLIKLRRKELKPDLIFLDLNMPIMTGQQFLSAIKKDEQLKDIPIIIFSTTTHQATIQLTKDMGAMDFITKPSNFFELVKILEKTL